MLKKISKKKECEIFKLRFQPVTQINMLKILSSIKNAEGLSIPQPYLNNLVQDSNGDIRSAINGLQFISNQVRKERATTTTKASSSKVVEFDKHVSKLSLFHAVGKVLYAKRNTDQTLESKPDVSFLSAKIILFKQC